MIGLWMSLVTCVVRFIIHDVFRSEETEEEVKVQEASEVPVVSQ